MTNTLRQVKDGDMLTFKNCLDVFIRWYVRNCDSISKMAEVWGEPEEDTLVSILSRGIIGFADQTNIIKEAEKQETERCWICGHPMSEHNKTPFGTMCPKKVKE